MSGEEPAVAEFVYDAVFCFDDLPNNRQLQDTDRTPEPLRPKWYPAARAPVPFSEDVFWSVLVRPYQDECLGNGSSIRNDWPSTLVLTPILIDPRSAGSWRRLLSFRRLQK